MSEYLLIRSANSMPNMATKDSIIFNKVIIFHNEITDEGKADLLAVGVQIYVGVVPEEILNSPELSKGDRMAIGAWNTRHESLARERDYPIERKSKEKVNFRLLG